VVKKRVENLFEVLRWNAHPGISNLEANMRAGFRGTLEIDSAENRGTTFRICLLSAAAAAAA
jgi:hypothetical protein